jgi:hypothetical protein
MLFFVTLAIAIGFCWLAWYLTDKKGMKGWENPAMIGSIITGIGAVLLISASVGIRGDSDSKVKRHGVLQALAPSLLSIRKHSDLEYAKLVQEIHGMNDEIQYAIDNNNSDWYGIFINDKLPTLPKIEIPKD